MEKTKGFTMVELLGVIVIIGILAGIVIFASSNITTNAKKKYCVSQESMVTLAGKDYYADYRSKLPTEIGAVEKVSLQTLIDGNYIKDGKVTDYKGDNCDYQNSYVAVQKQSEKEYNYYVYLKCEGCESGKQGTNPVVEFSPNSKSSNQPITVTMTIKDDEEVKSYAYVIYKNGSTYKTVNKTAYTKEVKISLTENGTYEIVGTGYDNQDNVGTTTSGQYVISNGKANCSVQISSSIETDAWNLAPATFTMQFASGVTDWEWYESKDGKNYIKKGNYKPTTKQVKIGEDGIYKVKVIAYDQYENACVAESGDYYVGEELKQVTLSGSIASGTLTEKDVTLTATVSPERAPKSETYQYIFEVQNGNTWETYQEGTKNMVTIKEEGKKTFRVRVKNSKKETISNTYVTYIDKNPPTAPTVTGKKEDGQAYSFGTWTNQSVTVIASGSQDAVSGFSHYEYRLKEGSKGYSSFAQMTNGTVLIKDQGEYTIQIIACDNIGHCMATDKAITKVIKIDKEKPSCTSSNPVDWTNQDVTVKGTCSDKGGSGCVANEVTSTISVEAGKLFNGTRSPGTVRDKAGNTRTCSAVSVKIDKEKPSCKSSDAVDWTNQNVTVKGTCSDGTGSGCEKEEVTSAVSVSTGKVFNGTRSPGTVTDKVGNSTSCSAVSVKIDKEKPGAPTVTNTNKIYWINSKATFALETTENDSGIDYWEYSYDDNTWYKYCTSLSTPYGCKTISGNYLKNNSQDWTKVSFDAMTTHYVLYFRAVDVAGNVSSKKSIEVPKIPTIKGTLSNVAKDPYISNTWTNSNIYLIASSPKPTTNIQFTYKFAENPTDKNDVSFYTKEQLFGNISVSTVSNTNYEKNYYAIACTSDGTCSSPSDAFYVKIDKKPPTLNYTSLKKADGASYVSDTWTKNQPITVQSEFYDDGSGVDDSTYVYKIILNSNTVSEFKERKHVVYSTATLKSQVQDKVGNLSKEEGPYNIKIDTTNPYTPTVDVIYLNNDTNPSPITLCENVTGCKIGSSTTWSCPSSIRNGKYTDRIFCNYYFTIGKGAEGQVKHTLVLNYPDNASGVNKLYFSQYINGAEVIPKTLTTTSGKNWATNQPLIPKAIDIGDTGVLHYSSVDDAGNEGPKLIYTYYYYEYPCAELVSRKIAPATNCQGKMPPIYNGSLSGFN